MLLQDGNVLEHCWCSCDLMLGELPLLQFISLPVSLPFSMFYLFLYPLSASLNNGEGYADIMKSSLATSLRGCKMSCFQICRIISSQNINGLSTMIVWCQNMSEEI